MAKIYYERNKNLGNYETVKLGIEIDVDTTAEDAYEKAKVFVVEKLKKEGRI